MTVSYISLHFLALVLHLVLILSNLYECQTIITMILIAEITQWLASFPLNPTLIKSPSLRWWEEPVEVEWQIVELLVPAVAAERSEPRPPRHPTVPCPVSDLQRVVQDHRDDESDGRR